MREIKFDLIYKGDTGFHHKKYYLEELMSGINKICDIHHQMKLIAKRQYTGLKDKNGVEIYEGDIKDLTGDRKYLIVVEWNDETCSFCAKSPNGELSGSLYGGQFSEVIGNIYENPELLEQQK